VSKRLLLVDDDLATRQVLARVLTREGFVIEDCSTLATALEHLRAAPFDVLLTDFVMPNGSGLELIAEATPLYPKLRCMIMSGHARPRDAASAVSWFEKPLDLDLLFAALHG
jgi:two-component system nitrogen regulation response regulator GlnG